MGFIVAEGRILEIDAIADPGRVRKIAAPVLGSSDPERSRVWEWGMTNEVDRDHMLPASLAPDGDVLRQSTDR